MWRKIRRFRRRINRKIRHLRPKKTMKFKFKREDQKIAFAPVIAFTIIWVILTVAFIIYTICMDRSNIPNALTLFGALTAATCLTSIIIKLVFLPDFAYNIAVVEGRWIVFIKSNGKYQYIGKNIITWHAGKRKLTISDYDGRTIKVAYNEQVLYVLDGVIGKKTKPCTLCMYYPKNKRNSE